ncbi:ROK family protein [Acetobacterium sp.]|jgi:glucokinase|uniref:ROK family protein n=1 Tax=Acetobacterium sp. TaxID=1872094 RepID=UPI000CBF2D5D|nr:ROK family glucokinase [Acetobacterium sp.]MDO9493905.1 ROK family glucokinase [Acetobacterium sp.]PKM74943.1 MAG: glucokinase [Firmicutes bacterium HGW-Firmicutes-17]
MGIGIDIGGTAIKGGIVDHNGVILEERMVNTQNQMGYAQVLSDLVLLIKELHHFSPEETTVGIGIPGILSADGATVVSCPNLNWKNRPLKKDLEKELSLEVLLVNDATAACIAEAAFGSTRGRSSSVMLTLGTGVGGGVIINDRVISGAHGVASEVGHMIMAENFYNCNCGKNGCLETFASATALIRYCHKRLAEGVESDLKTSENFDARRIFEAAKAGDSLALAAVNRLARYLGWAIANISDLIDPEIFTIGGGLSGAGEFLLERIKAETKSRLTYPASAMPEIVLASFRNDAGVVGAANLSRFI